MYIYMYKYIYIYMCVNIGINTASRRPPHFSKGRNQTVRKLFQST